MQKNEIRGEDRAANEVRLQLEAMPCAGRPQTRKRGRNCVPKFVVALLAPADLSVAFRGESTNNGAGAVRCRVAVCLSGAVRSFVHPAVHRSIKSNLIESIEADGCEVDVFAYATREDTVPRHKQVTPLPGCVLLSTHTTTVHSCAFFWDKLQLRPPIVREARYVKVNRTQQAVVPEGPVKRLEIYAASPR